MDPEHHVMNPCFCLNGATRMLSWPGAESTMDAWYLSNQYHPGRRLGGSIRAACQQYVGTLSIWAGDSGYLRPEILLGYCKQASPGGEERRERLILHLTSLPFFYLYSSIPHHVFLSPQAYAYGSPILPLYIISTIRLPETAL